MSMNDRPPGVNFCTHRDFIRLPLRDTHCKSVDTEQGLWSHCGDCDERVKVRVDRPYTLARWNEHKGFKKHKEAVARTARAKELKVISKQTSGKPLSRWEKSELKQTNTKQAGILQFASKKFASKKSKPATSLAASHATSKSVESLTKPSSCSGIFPDFNDTEFRSQIRAYSQYAAINKASSYKAGAVGVYIQFFSKQCNGTKGILRIRGRKGSITNCDSCNSIE